MKSVPYELALLLSVFPLLVTAVAFVIAPHDSELAEQVHGVQKVLQPADTSTLFPDTQEPREEVIQVSTETSGGSLPPEPLDDQPELTDTFATVAEFLEAGRPDRLIVFSADWCGPCQAYKQTLAPWQPSEAFDAAIQIIDTDKYPHLSRLFNVTAIPATHDGTNLFVGAQSQMWLRSRIPSLPTVETGNAATVTPRLQSAGFQQPRYYTRPMTRAEQRRAMRRVRR